MFRHPSGFEVEAKEDFVRIVLTALGPLCASRATTEDPCSRIFGLIRKKIENSCTGTNSSNFAALNPGTSESTETS